MTPDDGEDQPPADNSGDNPPRNIGSSPDGTTSAVPATPSKASSNVARKYARDICRTAEFFNMTYEERIDFLRENLAPGTIIPPGPVPVDTLADPLDKLAVRGFSAGTKRMMYKSPKQVEKYRGAKAEGTWEAYEQKYLGSYCALQGPRVTKQRKDRKSVV